jgi:hypothetical protein
MVADTWQTEPLPPVDDEYEGRRRRGLRRAGGGSRPGRAGWLVVLGVVLSLSAAVAVPFIITAPGSSDPLTAPTNRQATTSGPSGVASTGANGLPIIMAPSETPTPTPGSSATQSVSPSGTTVPGTSSSGPGPSSAPPPAATTNPPSQPPPPFTLTLEAEAAARAGCAVVRSFNGASGGQIVDRVGHDDDWGSWWGDGVVTFANVSLPAGSYTVTVYHVFNEANSDSSRAGRLRLDASGTSDDRNFDRNYPRTTTVQGWTTSSFTLSGARTFTITFYNPGVSGQDRSPALDRITIQQAS